MLVLDKNLQYSDLQVTVYRDDTLFYKFYALPDAPRVRKNQEDRPVFLLTKYAFSDQDREENEALPEGGGFLNMDVVFALTPEQDAEVRARLQQEVERIWNERKNLNPDDPEYQYKGPNAELASPQWVDGTVRFDIVNDPNLVPGTMTSGKPSMFGANNAIFNATLTPAGATYFQKTLTNPDGTGIDLTPIQVVYELSFMRRLPPARIIVSGSVREVYHAVSELNHDYDSHFWREDDFTTNESYSEYLSRSEVVRIHIDTGEYKADSDEIEELRSFAIGQLTQWLQNNIFERVTKFDPTYPDVEDVYSKEEDVYRMKTIDQVVQSRLYINITQTGLVEHTIHPQATLESFFGDMTEEQIAEHVREVDLTDPFFMTLDLGAKAYADYSEVSFVKVDVEYDGLEGLKTQSFNFESDNDAPGYWDPRLKDANREYRYRTTVGFKSSQDVIVSEWLPETTRQLNINVGRPGEINVDLLAGQVDWENVIEQVQVSISYEDSSNDIDLESQTFVLTKDAPSANYQRWIYANQERPVKWSAKYFLKNGHEVETGPDNTTDKQIVINDTFVGTLDVMVVPAGRIENVNQVIVDLRYEDRTGYRANKQFSINRADFFAAWKVPLIDPDERHWEWRKLVFYKDGTQETSSWESREGSSTLAVGWESPPMLEVTLNPVLLKFDRAPVVEVTVSYKGDVIDGDKSATFVFEDKTKQKWSLRIEDEDVTDYDWEITYYLDPEPVTVNGTSNKNNFILPRAPAA